MLAYGGEVDAGASKPGFLSFTCQPVREPWQEDRARSAPVVGVLHVAGDALCGQPNGVALAADHCLPGPPCVHEATQILHPEYCIPNIASRTLHPGYFAGRDLRERPQCTASARRQKKQLRGSREMCMGGGSTLAGVVVAKDKQQVAVAAHIFQTPPALEHLQTSMHRV